MRCPDCTRMVSYGEPTVEAQDLRVTAEEIEAEVRLVLPCGECDTELKEATLEPSVTIDHACDPGAVREYQAIEEAITEEDIERLIEEAGDGRYVVSGDGDWSAEQRSQTSGPGYKYRARKGEDGKPILRERLLKLGGRRRAKDGEAVELIGGGRYVRRMVPLTERIPTGKTEQWAPRYWRTFYGALGSVSVSCAVCGEAFDVELSDEVPAGAMDELT